MTTPILVLSQEEFAKIDRFIEFQASRQYTGKGRGTFDVEDVYQDGWIGLLEAWQRFDESKGIKLMSFAQTRIVGSMIEKIRYLTTGITSVVKTEDRRNYKEIYIYDDPNYERSKFYLDKYDSQIDFLLDCDIYLSRIGEREKNIFFRYYIINETFYDMEKSCGVSRPTANRILRALDVKIRDHMYED